MVVKQQTLHSFLQVEEVEIVEGHQVSVSSKDEHLVSQDTHGLSVTGTGFLADDEAVGFVVDDLLVDFALTLLLDAWMKIGVPIV